MKKFIFIHFFDQISQAGGLSGGSCLVEGYVLIPNYHKDICAASFSLRFLLGFFLGQKRGNVFYLPASIPTYMRDFKINCQGEVCKIDKPPR